jgi:hypothetical protein
MKLYLVKHDDEPVWMDVWSYVANTVAGGCPRSVAWGC